MKFCSFLYFDDVLLTHTAGALLQEDHYYPFGLGIAALSSTAPLSKPNKFKYNGFEEQTDFDLGWYDYQARNYDPQLGRWFNVDPAADLMRRHSPYNYAFDNPVRFIDPDGMMPEDVQGQTNCPDGCPPETEPDFKFKSRSPLKAALRKNVVDNVRIANRSTKETFSGTVGVQGFGVGVVATKGNSTVGAVAQVAGVELEGRTDGKVDVKATSLSFEAGLKIEGFGGASSSLVAGESSYNVNSDEFNDTGDLVKLNGNIDAGELQFSTGSDDTNSFSVKAAVGFVTFKVKADLNAVGRAVESYAKAAGNWILNTLGVDY